MEQSKTTTYKYGCAEIVVHRPVLDDQERQKREAAVKRALACFGKAQIENKRKG